MDSFSRHSLARGLAAKIIAKKKSLPNVSRYYLMGVLHNVGHLIVYLKASESANEILAQSQAEGK